MIEMFNDGNWVPRAGACFIRNRWSTNGLYVYDRIDDGETVQFLIQRGYNSIELGGGPASDLFLTSAG